MTHASTADSHQGGHGQADHGSSAKYWYVFFALVFLTSLSFFTYSRYWTFGHEVARMFMMAVSCTKAMLVIMFFMHVKYEANWKYVLTIPPGIMAVLLMLALVPDIGLRGRRLSEERVEHMAVPRVERVQHDGASPHAAPH